jgi:Uma2 family endonuclease
MTTEVFGASREQAARMSDLFPGTRIEITPEGVMEVTVTPTLGRHGRWVSDLSAWLVGHYGRGRVASEVGIDTGARTGGQSYREADLALFHGIVPGDVRYHDPSTIALVVEVESESTRAVDWAGKVADYAAAGIVHYWIVDPQHATVALFRLGNSGTYVSARANYPLDSMLDEDDPQYFLALPR